MAVIYLRLLAPSPLPCRRDMPARMSARTACVPGRERFTLTKAESEFEIPIENRSEMTRTFVWLLLVSVVLLLSSVAMTQQPTVKPVASVTQLMRAMIIPASNALFNVTRQAPTNDKEWAAVENNAVILGESGNLLMMGSRAMNTEAWMKSSQALADAGALALKAAEARNVEAVPDAGNLIVDACETCHEKHWDRSQQN